MKVKLVEELKERDDSFNKSMEEVLSLLGQAHDKVNEALDILNDLNSEYDVESDEIALEEFIWNVEDLESDMSNFDLMGEESPLDTWEERYSVGDSDFSESLSLKEDDEEEKEEKEIDEPLDEPLPDAQPSEPIIVDTNVEEPIIDEPIIEPSIDKEAVDNGIASMINNLIVDEFDAIEGYNSAIATVKELLPEDDSAIVVLNDILNEENVHVGQLQELLKTVSPSANEIESGKEEAQEVLEQEPVEEVEIKDEEEVEESLKEGYLKSDDETGKLYCSIDGKNWEECSQEEWDELDKGGYIVVDREQEIKEI